jgi:hypothetical protein
MDLPPARCGGASARDENETLACGSADNEEVNVTLNPVRS